MPWRGHANEGVGDWQGEEARDILAGMAWMIAVVALAVSVLLLGTVLTILVMLRRGDGPVYSANRLYDANRREAIHLLTGAEVEGLCGEQWFLRARREAARSDPLEAEVGAAVVEALRAVVPADRGLVIDTEGRARLEGAVVVPAVSTADLRASGVLEAWQARSASELLVALVLVNPEPPGGDARRVALPVQILFPALERAGRDDLVHRFAALRDRAAEPVSAEVS